MEKTWLSYLGQTGLDLELTSRLVVEDSIDLLLIVLVCCYCFY